MSLITGELAMQQPHYIFLPKNRYILAISDSEVEEMTLIHPFDTAKRCRLKGQLTASLQQQLQSPSASVAATLDVIAKQHDWLMGLSSASLKPFEPKHLVIGDTLGLLFLEITDQCNEQCIHCYASSSPACSDFLSLAEIKAVLEQARALGRPIVQFTGGDPLIHRHLVEAIAFTHALDFQSIEIYTNGLLLNDKLLQQLLPYAPSFAFSLYSPDEMVHDGITQVKGSFKKTIAAMHRAQALDANIRIGMAIMEQNAGHEQAMLDFAQVEFALTAKSVRFDPVHETGRGSNLNTKHISLMPSKNSHMPDEEDVVHHQVVQTDKVKQTSPANKKVQRKGKLAVCANGNISPCIFNREHVLGNVRQQSLLSAIESASHVGNSSPSITRWNFCQYNLSCSDCQMVAYTLGEAE
ncbi:MAG TPA: radical SAM protein [Ghiorsea sp.]|nr:radical SAM protein [Ghiorsea sp.]